MSRKLVHDMKMLYLASDRPDGRRAARNRAHLGLLLQEHTVVVPNSPRLANTVHAHRQYQTGP